MKTMTWSAQNGMNISDAIKFSLNLKLFTQEKTLETEKKKSIQKKYSTSGMTIFRMNVF